MGDLQRLSLLVIILVGLLVCLKLRQLQSMVDLDPDEAEAMLAAESRREVEALTLPPGRVIGLVKSHDGRAVTGS